MSTIDATGWGYTAATPAVNTLDAANSLVNDWINQYWNEQALVFDGASNELKQRGQAVAADYLSLSTEYTDLLSRYLTLLAQLQGAAIAAQQGGGPTDEAIAEEAGNNDLFIPEEWTPLTIDIQPFQSTEELDKTNKELEEKKKQPKRDLDPYFAKKTNETQSFSPTIHQNNTFRQTVPIDPYFRKEDDGSTEEYRGKSRESSQARHGGS